MQNTTKKLNNEGFSLVELIVSFAILVIVTLAIIGMMATGMRFFRSVTSNIGLQYEYQTVMTQLREYVLDCNAGIAVEGSTLYIVSQQYDDPADPANEDIRYTTQVITLAGDTLYYMIPQIGLNVPADITIPADPSTQPDVFFEVSERMTDFNMMLNPIKPDIEADEYYTSLISTQMGFRANERTYSASQDITMRNRVFIPVLSAVENLDGSVTYTFGTYDDLQDILDLTP